MQVLLSVTWLPRGVTPHMASIVHVHMFTLHPLPSPPSPFPPAPLQVLLSITWSRQGALPLMSTTLASLLLCGVLLATDAARPGDGGGDDDGAGGGSGSGGGEPYSQDRIAG